MGAKWLAHVREVGGGGGGRVLFLILAALLLFPASAKIARDPAQVRAFKQQNACPATGKIQDKCPGYVVDHIIPLCAGGDDAPSNMQWQDYATSLLKDRWERQLCTWQRHRPSPNCAPPPPPGAKMTAEIHILDVDTTLDIPAERILTAAVEAELESCLVVGCDQEGELYLASTTSDMPRILWLLEKAKMFLLSS